MRTTNTTSFADSTPSVIDLYCERVERHHEGCPLTIYVLRDGLPRQLRMHVLEHVRLAHVGVRVNMIGREIAAFSLVGSDIGTL